MDAVDIYRGTDLLVTVEPDNNSTQTKEVMGKNQVVLNFELNNYVSFKIGDYFTAFSELYKVSNPPSVEKTASNAYSFSIIADSESFDLVKAQFLFLDQTNHLTESDFDLMGTGNTFVDLILQNINRISSGWTKGQVENTTYKVLSFSKDNCYSALQKIANELGVEYSVEGKVIHLTKRLFDTGKSFKVGQNKGLYKITRQNLDSSSIITRLYAYGSDKNLPPDYANFSKRLRLPNLPSPRLISNVTCSITNNGDGTQTITFYWSVPTDPDATAVTIHYKTAGSSPTWGTSTGSINSPRALTMPVGSYDVYFTTHGSSFANQDTAIITITGNITQPALYGNPLSFVEQNVSQYGIIEATEIFDDIFPNRTGKVTSVKNNDPFTFYDLGIDFDINGHLLPGATPKVTFNTGQLAGYAFEIRKFTMVNKEVVILKNKDERSIDLPSNLFKPAIGDEYVITDIEMPSTYIQAAERALLSKAKTLLAQYATPQATYAVELDPIFMRKKNYGIRIGELVWVTDEDLGIQRKIRVTQVTRNIVNEWTYQVTISDIVSPSTIAALQISASNNQTSINNINQSFQNNSILNNNVIGDLKMIGTATIDFDNIPTTKTLTGFSQIFIEDLTGKLYKKV